MMDQAEVVLKIRKLLDLASREKNPSAHEAEAAMAKVAELLRKYQLDLVTVEQAVKPQEDDFVTSPYGEPFRRKSSQSKFVWSIVQEFFNVKIFSSYGLAVVRLTGRRMMMRRLFESAAKDGRRLCFLGRKTEVAIAQYVYGFLDAEFERQWNRHHKETGAAASARNGFYAGLYRGLRERLDHEERNRLEATPPSVQQSMAIVIRNERTALGEYVHSIFPSLGRGSVYRGPSDTSSYADGVAAGRDLNIHPAVNEGTGRRSLPGKPK